MPEGVSAAQRCSVCRGGACNTNAQYIEYKKEAMELVLINEKWHARGCVAPVGAGIRSVEEPGVGMLAVSRYATGRCYVEAVLVS